MNIRPALESDALGVARVHVYTWQTAYRGIVPDAYLESLSLEKRESTWRVAIANGAPELWVADSGSEITGWAIYVMPSSWGKGLGQSLWLVARRRLVQRGFQSATLWVLKDNLRATRFYRAAGFVEDLASEKEIAIGGQKLWEVRYVATFA
jgi:ribosomal protein S18 acetylase RimI-like enzyme